MARHVAEGPAIYRPGACWSDLSSATSRCCAPTASADSSAWSANNHYNWLVTSWLDRARNAAIGWLRHPTLAPLRARTEPALAVRTMARNDGFDLSPVAARRYRFFIA